jgi:hypothetical protein
VDVDGLDFGDFHSKIPLIIIASKRNVSYSL